jgi:16S rRNA (cytosine1402-N4)-methyltransferase
MAFSHPNIYSVYLKLEKFGILKPMTCFGHSPVMPEEVTRFLQLKPEGIYADGTLGGGGHALRVVQALSSKGLLVGIDRDENALAAAATRLDVYKDRFLALHGNFHELPRLLNEQGIFEIDGVLLDLGMSSHQLDTAERGFSYRLDGRLDMRMDNRESLTAYEIVNRYPEKRLAEIIFAYGEERFAKKIARAIINERPVETTLQLATLIEKTVPVKPRTGHAAMRTFQALRIEVNDELKPLNKALCDIINILKPGGRICVITFHSLEDRIVKTCFRTLAGPCTCPRNIPYCVCGKVPLVKCITRKPVLPGKAEINENRRAHSAKLRVAEKI